MNTTMEYPKHYELLIDTADGNRYIEHIAADNMTEAEAVAAEWVEEYDDVENYYVRLSKERF